MKKVVSLWVLLLMVAATGPVSANGSNSQPSHKTTKTFEAEVSVDAETPTEEVGGVLVEWDKWRNRFLRAAWSNWGERLDGGLHLGLVKLGMSAGKHMPQFAHGTAATFHCTVTKQKRIQDLKIVDSSGDQQFDDMVLASVRSLEGSHLLEFPKQTQRQFVEQTCTFRIGSGSQFHDHQFDDRESVPSS